MPSPLATAQTISPLFRSIAVSFAYGGLNGSGRPCGPSIFGHARFTHGMFDSGCSRVHEADDVRHVRRRDVEDAGFRIERRAAPVGAAVGAGQEDRALLALRRADDFRRRVERAVVVFVDDAERFGLELRRVVEQVLVRRRPADRTPAASSGSAASANTTRRALRPSAPAALRSARSACLSRDPARNVYACFVTCAIALTFRPLTVMSVRIGAAGRS